MLEIVALIACLSDSPRCDIVRTYSSMEACQSAKTYIEHTAPIEWAPLHCEAKKPDA